MKERPLKVVDSIVVHCSATPTGRDVPAAEIRRWHLARGFDDIGYHYVIGRHGELEIGRDLMYVGAHARGHNYASIGICLIGGTHADNRKTAEANFSLKQYMVLNELVADLNEQFGRRLAIVGHRDLNPAKACPSFNVEALFKP